MTNNTSKPMTKPMTTDTELDSAMRELTELEAAEAAERDLAVLRDVWARRTGKPPGFFASRLIAFCVGAAALLLPALAAAEEPKKEPKPVLCMSGTPVGANGVVGFVCTDGKRPRILLPYIEVQFADADGNASSYVLGWPAKNTRKVPLPKRLPKDEAPRKRVAEGTVKL